MPLGDVRTDHDSGTADQTGLSLPDRLEIRSACSWQALTASGRLEKSLGRNPTEYESVSGVDGARMNCPNQVPSAFPRSRYLPCGVAEEARCCSVSNFQVSRAMGLPLGVTRDFIVWLLPVRSSSSGFAYNGITWHSTACVILQFAAVSLLERVHDNSMQILD